MQPGKNKIKTMISYRMEERCIFIFSYLFMNRNRHVSINNIYIIGSLPFHYESLYKMKNYKAHHRDQSNYSPVMRWWYILVMKY